MPSNLLIIGLLVASLAGTGVMLFKAHQQIGAAKSEIKQWVAANQHWSDAWANRDKEEAAAQGRMIKREDHYQQIEELTNEHKKQIAELEDESGCLDTDLGDAFWLPIADGANYPTAKSMPSGEQGATTDHADP